jgi:hypothetical protein
VTTTEAGIIIDNQPITIQTFAAAISLRSLSDMPVKFKTWGHPWSQRHQAAGSYPPDILRCVCQLNGANIFKLQYEIQLHISNSQDYWEIAVQ